MTRCIYSWNNNSKLNRGLNASKRNNRKRDRWDAARHYLLERPNLRATQGAPHGRG